MSNTNPWMHLHKSGQVQADGLHLLYLDLYEGDKRVDRLPVVSGGPAYQVFRTGAQSRAGSMEPIPEGHFLTWLTEWAGRPGDWTVVFSSALGPFINVVENAPGYWTERGDLRLHMDWNREEGSPGTAGCIGFQDESVAQRWLNWRAKFSGGIELFVDYGLGTVKLPTSGTPTLPPSLWVKAYLNEGRTSALVDGQKVSVLDTRFLRNADGSCHYWRNGVERKPVSVRIEILERK